MRSVTDPAQEKGQAETSRARDDSRAFSEQSAPLTSSSDCFSSRVKQRGQSLSAEVAPEIVK
jgi:hypothetical protein